MAALFPGLNFARKRGMALFWFNDDRNPDDIVYFCITSRPGRLSWPPKLRNKLYHYPVHTSTYDNFTWFSSTFPTLNDKGSTRIYIFSIMAAKRKKLYRHGQRASVISKSRLAGRVAGSTWPWKHEKCRHLKIYLKRDYAAGVNRAQNPMQPPLTHCTRI